MTWSGKFTLLILHKKVQSLAKIKQIYMNIKPTRYHNYIFMTMCYLTIKTHPHYKWTKSDILMFLSIQELQSILVMLVSLQVALL